MATKMPRNGPDFWRQQGLLPPSALEDVTVHLIGAGGIGSPTALTLAKMGIPNMIIWDDDTVEQHNLPNQLYRWQDLDQPKAEALRGMLAEFAATRVETRTERYTETSEPLSGIVVCAVDSMAARQSIWNRVKGNPDIPLYVEARMGAEVLRVHAVDPNDDDSVAWYETTLYDDSEAIEAPCTAGAIIYTVMAAAALIGDLVKRHVRQESYPREVILDLINLMFV